MELGESCQHRGLGRSMSVDEIQLLDEKESAALRSRCMSADDADEPPEASEQGTGVPSKRTMSFSDEWTRWMSSSNSNKPKFADGTDVNDDEQASVDSNTSAYYDPTDFLPTNWTHAVHMIPPMGLAVVAGGFALTHPIMFIAGTVAAYGTAHAAGACSDCCADGYPCMWNQEQVDEEVEAKRLDEALHGGRATSECTVESSDDDPKNRVDASMSAQLVASSEKQDPTPSTSSPAADNGDQTTEVSLLKQRPMEWIEKYYPELEHVAVGKAQFFGLNAAEFFNVFFANDAPFTSKEIHKQRGDKDIEYGSWKALDGHQKLSLIENGPSCKDKTVASFLRERVLSFKAKTNSYFGPPFADTTKVQRVLMASKRLMVMESKTTVKDIPFCDRFYVMERWVVTAEKQVHAGVRQYVSNLSIHSQVFFSKKCSFESQIESKSTSSILEVSTAWCTMAKAALELTEASRMKRIHGSATNDWEHLDDDASHLTHPSVDEAELNRTPRAIGDEECIEVQHIGPSRSFVLGEAGEKENAEPMVDVINMPSSNSKGSDSRSRTSSFGSFSKMGRSITNYVRRRTVSPELR